MKNQSKLLIKNDYARVNEQNNERTTNEIKLAKKRVPEKKKNKNMTIMCLLKIEEEEETHPPPPFLPFESFSPKQWTYTRTVD